MTKTWLHSRRRTGRYSCVLIFSLVCTFGRIATTQQAEATPPKPDPHPELQRLDPEASVWLDLKDRRVVVAGAVALTEGPVEFFACPRKTKEHESVVSVDSTARLIHAALLAIGLKPGRPAIFDADYQPATGDPVAVEVRWLEGTTPQRAAAQEWIRNSRTGKQLSSNWVFAGSRFWKDPQSGIEYYQADGGDLVCVSNFPTAMLDLPIASSDANESLLFEVFAERVPPQETPVELIFSKANASGEHEDKAASTADKKNNRQMEAVAE